MSETAPRLVYQDDDILILNKPAGLLVHESKIKNRASRKPTLVDWLLENYPEVKTVGDDPENRPGIVHRLDRDTSGVLLVCRNQKAFAYFKNLFQTRQIKKTYLALVYGKLKEREGVIDKPLGLVRGTVRRTVHQRRAKMIKEATTKYRVKKVFELDSQQVSLLEVELLTGRTHQIRVHLAAIGHPLAGDTWYGLRRQKLTVPRMFLHAESLEFKTPAGTQLKISADLPDDLSHLMR